MMNAKMMILGTFLIIVVIVVMIFSVVWAVNETEPKTCEEKASQAQRWCQARTEQPCVDVFDQHLKACRDAESAVDWLDGK